MTYLVNLHNLFQNFNSDNLGQNIWNKCSFFRLFQYILSKVVWEKILEEKMDIFKNRQKGAEMPPKHYQKGGGGKKNAARWVFARNERLARMARSRNPKVKACLYQIVKNQEKQSMSTPPPHENPNMRKNHFYTMFLAEIDCF